MPLWKRSGFLIVFVVPALMPVAAWLGARSGHHDAMAWFPLFFLFVLLPLVDYALGHDPDNPPLSAASALGRGIAASMPEHRLGRFVGAMQGRAAVGQHPHVLLLGGGRRYWSMPGERPGSRRKNRPA